MKLVTIHSIQYTQNLQLFTKSPLHWKCCSNEFRWCAQFLHKCFGKLHINLKLFYHLLHENSPWNWTKEHERLFQQLKTLTSETELTFANTKHPFFITVDSSLIGLGAVIFQLYGENKKKVISYNSRILNPQEQKPPTLDRELLGSVHALLIYELLKIGSTHSIYIFTDHKLLLQCFTKKVIEVHNFTEHKCS